MRRTITLFFALLIALWGLSILAAGEPSALVALRDGIVVIVGAAVLFAVASRPVSSVWHTVREDRSLPSTSSVLAVLGFAVGIGGSAWLLSLLRAGADDAVMGWALLTWFAAMIVLGVAALWPHRRNKEEVTAVWSVRAAEDYLRSAPDEETATATPFSRRTIVLSLIIVTAIAGLLRIWNFAGLPIGCVDDCSGALQALTFLREDSWRGLLLSEAPLYTLLLALVFGLLAPGMDTLGWLGIGLGTATVPLFFAAARAIARFPVALIGALLLAFAPWHIVLSRTPQTATLLVFTLVAAILACRWAAKTRRPQRWILAGQLAGLAALTASGWTAAVLVLWWFLAMPPASWRSRLLYWAGLLATAAPALALLVINTPPLALTGVLTARVIDVLEVWASDVNALIAVTVVLALLGLAHLLRRPRWAGSRLLVVGVAAILLPTLTSPAAVDVSLHVSLIYLLMTLTALVTLDQILGALIESWSTAVRPTTLTAFAAGAATLLLIFAALAALRQTEDIAAAPVTSAAVGRYLQESFERSVDNGGEENAVIFVPADVLQSPATQLAAGGVLPFAKRILPLDPTTNLPPATSPFVDIPNDGDVRYVIPIADRALLEYVGQIYPNYVGEAIADPNAGTPAAYVATVSREQIEADRGLAVTYFSLDNAEPDAELPMDAVESGIAGPLEFVWDEAPLAPPFAMQAQGMLFVPEAGQYLFSAEMDDDAQLRMTLGDDIQSWTLIDTAGGEHSNAVTLAQGYFPVEIEYRSGDEATSLSIRWQRPEGKVEPIPREALYQKPVPQGVLATYYAENVRLEAADAAEPMRSRREPLLRTGPAAIGAGTIIWETKVAAPIDGSYVFSAEANGRFDLLINGIVLADAADTAANLETFERVTAAVQLRRGWHDLLIRYEPAAGEPSFVLRWQPVGYQESEIPSALLAPYPAEVSVDALAIPDVPLEVSAPAPAAVFDLPDLLESEENPLPLGLPELPLQLMWTAGTCNEDGFQPRGVALWPERNLLLATDVGNARVLAYDLAVGEVVTTYTDESWVEPFDLGRNNLGAVYLVDAVAQQIYRIGEEEDVFDPIEQETSFYRPRGLGVSADGSLVVADTGGARVVVLTAEGSVRAQYGGPDTALGRGQPVDALLQPNGALWVITAEDGQLWRLDQGSGQASTARANTFTGPHLTGLPNNGLLITDPERRLLTYYSAGGVALAQFQEGGFMTPVGIDAAGVADQLLLAVSDSGACEVSLWQMPLADLP